MPRKSNIRWRESDVEKLERTINAFNQRLYRQQKKNPENISALPERQNVKNVMKDIETRSDFNRYLAKLERFKGKEKYEIVENVNATQWAVDELKINERIVSMKRTKREKKINETPVTLRNEPVGYTKDGKPITRMEMGKAKEIDKTPPAKLEPEKMNPTEFQMAVQMMEKQMRANYDYNKKKLLKENYIKGLIRVGISEQVQQIVASIPLDEFVTLLNTDEIGDLDFIYSPEELEVKETELHDFWYEHATLDKYGVPVNVDDVDIENLDETVRYENYLMQYADDETRAKVGMSHKRLSPAEKQRRKEERRRKREQQKRNGK